MIEFHHYVLPEMRRFGPMPVPAGTPACAVFLVGSADPERELLAWAKAHGVPRHWLRHEQGSGRPHLEVWGSALEECREKTVALAHAP